MSYNDCTLLLSSYDGGSDLWDGFFKALKCQWQDFDLPVVLNTEHKSFSFPGLNIRVINYTKKHGNWGDRLIKCLKQIDTEFVLFFLDDFWLDSKVDTLHFEKCRQWMRDDKKISVMYFQRLRGKKPQSDKYDRFEIVQFDTPYRMNCQAALWRREKLIQYIRPHESAWEFEEYGTRRSKRYNDDIYSIIEGEKPVFSYDLKHGGVIHRGKWNRDVVKPLADLYSIYIDYDRRGFWDDYAASNIKPKRCLIRGVKNRIHKFLSLI